MSNEKKNGSTVNQNPLTSYINQVNSHLTAIAALTGASAGFLKDMAQKLVKVEAETARLRELLKEYGECEICKTTAAQISMRTAQVNARAAATQTAPAMAAESSTSSRSNDKRRMMTMKTLSIMNVKGGVGKTITAVNIAVNLAVYHQKRVLLIDADAQGDATAMLMGVDDPDEFSGGGLFGAIVQGGNIGEYIEETKYRNLDLMPGCSDLFEISMDDAQRVTGIMDGIIDTLDGDGEYDVILIDCPPSFNAPSIGAICNSDFIIVPCKLDGFSIRGARFLLRQCDIMQDYAMISPMILVTMYHNCGVCNQAMELLHTSMPEGIKILNQVIRRTDKVDESTFYGQALGEYSRQSAAGRDYKDLTVELLGEMGVL